MTTLQRLVRQTAEIAAAAQERCELCAEPIPAEHRHLLEVARNDVQCVCYACSILFNSAAASDGRLRLIPDRRRLLADFVLSDAEWETLSIPVGLAFVLESTGSCGVMAFYPSPLGATQAMLEASVWERLRDRCPVLHTLQPDVEALLINRARGAADHYLVPIDDCFRLVGIIRTNWRGLTGGREVWEHVAGFFAALRLSAEGAHP